MEQNALNAPEKSDMVIELLLHHISIKMYQEGIWTLPTFIHQSNSLKRLKTWTRPNLEFTVEEKKKALQNRFAILKRQSTQAMMSQQESSLLKKVYKKPQHHGQNSHKFHDNFLLIHLNTANLIHKLSNFEIFGYGFFFFLKKSTDKLYILFSVWWNIITLTYAAKL